MAKRDDSRITIEEHALLQKGWRRLPGPVYTRELDTVRAAVGPTPAGMWTWSIQTGEAPELRVLTSGIGGDLLVVAEHAMRDLKKAARRVRG